jgi:DNA mismatch repair protein MutL
MIQRLSNETIGKIAAGEVIERPAAAVKELIENAIDAGARRIEISIAGGGVDLIEVRDDGAGIGYDELPLTVERHATSKISAIDDLRTLTTLGFRGEALASLAAVSDLAIQSRRASEASGGSIRARFGTIEPARPIGWSHGTCVTARDLFGNVPARRKFLRLEQTEAGYVARVVVAYALGYPGISFSYQSDGRKGFTTDGSGDAIGAAVAVWGAEVAGSMVTLQSPAELAEGFAVSGIVSSPAIDRATRQQQFLFVQGRLISSRQIGAAFEQAYHTLLMIGRHPLGCIRVVVPADRIDVNVHPTKAEVRFGDERLVFAMVQRAVREAIVAVSAARAAPTVISSPLTDASIQRRIALAHPDLHAPTASDAPPIENAWTVHHALAGGSKLPVLRVLGQIAGMFVIAEGPDGMYLIDQHAAHERILFERLVEGQRSRAPDRQLLLQPTAVDLSPRQVDVLANVREDLEAIGFDVEAFGERAIVLRAVPAVLKIRDPREALVAILDELGEGGRGDSQLESIAISAACHTSIRAGQALSLLEMRELVVQLEQCASPLSCGHGRPTMLRMTADELERLFARR